jgi:hypothetical protein
MSENPYRSPEVPVDASPEPRFASRLAAARDGGARGSRWAAKWTVLIVRPLIALRSGWIAVADVREWGNRSMLIDDYMLAGLELTGLVFLSIGMLLALTFMLATLAGVVAAISKAIRYRKPKENGD